MAGTTVNLFRSTDAGAPVLSADQGTLINVLDACLINGYNQKTITITRSGQTATATCTSHGYALDGGTKIRISGAGQAQYNGDFTIFNVTTNTFDFTVEGSPASPATGTITAIVAPLGWSKPFSGTGMAAYRSNVVTGTRLYLQVNDNNPDANTYGTARVRGYESMSDVSTGTGPFPTTTQLANGYWFAKSALASGVSRPWILIGDGYEFFLLTLSGTTWTDYKLYHFGDFNSLMQSDPYGCLISGDIGVSLNQQGGVSNSLTFVSSITTLGGNATSGYIARAYHQLGASLVGYNHSTYTLGGSDMGIAGVVPFPNPSNNGLYFSRINITDGLCLRGYYGGWWKPLHTRPFKQVEMIPASANHTGRRLLAIPVGGLSSLIGECAFDIDGPWR